MANEQKDRQADSNLDILSRRREMHPLRVRRARSESQQMVDLPFPGAMQRWPFLCIRGAAGAPPQARIESRLAHLPQSAMRLTKGPPVTDLLR